MWTILSLQSNAQITKYNHQISRLFSYTFKAPNIALYIYIQILCRLASNTSWCPTRGTTCSIASRKSLRASGQGDDDVDDDGQDVFVYIISSVFVYIILFVFVFLVLIPIPARGGSSGQWQRGKWSDVLSACHPSLQQSYCCICIFIFIVFVSVTRLCNKASVFVFCICIYILYLYLLTVIPLCNEATAVFVVLLYLLSDFLICLVSPLSATKLVLYFYFVFVIVFVFIFCICICCLPPLSAAKLILYLYLLLYLLGVFWILDYCCIGSVPPLTATKLTKISKYQKCYSVFRIRDCAVWWL